MKYIWTWRIVHLHYCWKHFSFLFFCIILLLIFWNIPVEFLKCFALYLPLFLSIKVYFYSVCIFYLYLFSSLYEYTILNNIDTQESKCCDIVSYLILTQLLLENYIAIILFCSLLVPTKLEHSFLSDLLSRKCFSFNVNNIHFCWSNYGSNKLVNNYVNRNCSSIVEVYNYNHLTNRQQHWVWYR